MKQEIKQNINRSHRSGSTAKWLTKPEAAAYLSCNVRFIERLVTERRIPFHRMGKFIRLSKADLDEFLESGRVEAVK